MNVEDFERRMPERRSTKFSDLTLTTDLRLIMVIKLIMIIKLITIIVLFKLNKFRPNLTQPNLTSLSRARFSMP